VKINNEENIKYVDIQFVFVDVLTKYRILAILRPSLTYKKSAHNKFEEEKIFLVCHFRG